MPRAVSIVTRLRVSGRDRIQSGTGRHAVCFNGDEAVSLRGDWQQAAATVMASVSRVPEFDAAVESFGAYSKRLEQHSVANSVGED